MIDEDDQICGAVVNIRKGQDKLCLWTKDENNRDAVVKIGYVYREDVIITRDNRLFLSPIQKTTN